MSWSSCRFEGSVEMPTNKAGRISRSIAQVLRNVLPQRARPIGYLTHLVRKGTQDTVRGGPFRGMRYADRAIGSAYLPKLLGTYERELGPTIEEACADSPALILDVGAAEGYYAVGLALRNPQARVVAFETQPEGQALLRKMAALNGVAGRVEIRGHCDPLTLQAALNDQFAATMNSAPLLVCDAEGEEVLLLNPQPVPILRRTSILVETHDFVRPGVTGELCRRFRPTHSIRRIPQTPRSWNEFPFRSLGTRLLPKSYLNWAVSEWRPVPMCWLWMRPYV